MCDLVKRPKKTELGTPHGLLIPFSESGKRTTVDWWLESSPSEPGKVQCHHGDGNWEDLPTPTDDESVYIPSGSYIRMIR